MKLEILLIRCVVTLLAVCATSTVFAQTETGRSDADAGPVTAGNGAPRQVFKPGTRQDAAQSNGHTAINVARAKSTGALPLGSETDASDAPCH